MAQMSAAVAERSRMTSFAAERRGEQRGAPEADAIAEAAPLLATGVGLLQPAKGTAFDAQRNHKGPAACRLQLASRP